MPSRRNRAPISTDLPPVDLGDRQAAILEAVVTRYIGTAQPVGSSHVAEAAELNLSTATIRTEMAQLEHEGYLTQPHTSAGRIPTDKGYRFFVDHLAKPGIADASQRRKVSSFFKAIEGEMEDVLERSSAMLADLTQYAAVVVAPGHGTSTVRSAQLVSLGATAALLLVVLTDGSVEKVTVDLGASVEEATIEAVSRHLQATLGGKSLHEALELEAHPAPEVAAVLATLEAPLRSLCAEADAEQVFVGGPSKLASAFDAVETVREVLSILEQQLVVVSLLRDVLESGLSVAIGHEHGYEPLSSCAVIVAPLSVDGTTSGAVGLLGPTRMQYPAALAAATAVSEELSDRLAGAGSGSTSTKVRHRG